MKVMEFIEKYKNEVSMFDVKRYLPLNAKRTIARDAIDINIDDVNGFIEIDEVVTDACFEMGIICEYAGLESDNVIADYDALNESGLMGIIISKIGQDYFNALQVLVKEKEAVLARNSIEAQVAKLIDSLTNTIESLSEKMDGAIGSFDMSKILPEGTNLNEMFEMLNKYK